MTSRREELLELAEQVLEQHGLDAFGLGPVARAAGIRTPSLYKHFASLADLEHALMSRGFLRLAHALDQASETHEPHEPRGPREVSTPSAAPSPQSPLAKFAGAYRAHAMAHPQLYRLMTERPLDRAMLTPGAEEAAMAALLGYFGESLESHDTARAAWAGAHGLVSLELAGRFPAGSDLDAAWMVYTSAFTR